MDDMPPPTDEELAPIKAKKTRISVTQEHSREPSPTLDPPESMLMGCPHGTSRDLHDGPIHGPQISAERMGGGGLRIFDSIAQEWGLSPAEQIGLLRVPEDTFTAWMKVAKTGQDVAVDEATLERLGQLMRIWRELAVLLPSSHAGWIQRPNNAPLFCGKPALELMLANPAGLAAVLAHLLGWSGGWS